MIDLLIVASMIKVPPALEDLYYKYKDVPYRWGGESTRGIDCSGFVQMYLRKIELDPPGDQSAQALYNYARNNWRAIPEDKAKPGDLIFYWHKTGADPNNKWGGRRIRHAGIYWGAGRMLDASSKAGGVDITSTKRPGYIAYYYRPLRGGSSE